jgi:hypothetical protein
MRKVSIGAVAALTASAALVLAAGASAETLRLKGQVVGQPRSKAEVTVVRDKHNNLKAIKKLKFTRIAATCSDGTSGAISGADPRPFAIHGKNFTRKTRVLGTGIDHGYFKATGKFRRGGKAAKGTVRFAFKTTAGAGCGTGRVLWRGEV